MADSFIPESTKPETSEAVELLPCPFCASSDAEMQPVLVRDQHGPCVICPACSAVGAVRDSQAEAIAAWNTRAALSAPPAGQNVERMREGWKLVPVGEPVSLADCPPGPFLFDGSLGFKTEYGAMETVGPTDVPGSQIRWTVGRAPDAYCIDSGEYFWGGATSKDARAALIVQPLAEALAAAPSVAIGAGEVGCLKCGGEWCSVDLCLPATPSKAGSPSAAVKQESWTGNPHGLANELRRVANLWRPGFRLPQLLRDAADEIDCLAPGSTPPSASIPADVERAIGALIDEADRARRIWRPKGHETATQHARLDCAVREARAALAGLAARPFTPQANDAPSILDRTPRTHPYKPHAKFPWFCDVCGYAEHERLQHPAPATPQANDGTSIPDGEERA